jgi:hypothetical protein
VIASSVNLDGGIQVLNLLEVQGPDTDEQHQQANPLGAPSAQNTIVGVGCTCK